VDCCHVKTEKGLRDEKTEKEKCRRAKGHAGEQNRRMRDASSSLPHKSGVASEERDWEHKASDREKTNWKRESGERPRSSPLSKEEKKYQAKEEKERETPHILLREIIDTKNNKKRVTHTE